jgi:Na+/H+-translocating membrane pyrophosphatase
MLLINLIASNYLSLSESAAGLQNEKAVMLHILGTLYCFLLGVLVEWRTVVKLIKKEAKLSFSTPLIPGFIILLISCISPIIIITRIGIIFPFPFTSFLSFFIGPLSHSTRIQNLFSVVAGA